MKNLIITSVLMIFMSMPAHTVELTLVSQDNCQFVMERDEIVKLRKMLPTVDVMLQDMGIFINESVIDYTGLSNGRLPLPVSKTTLVAITHSLRNNGFHGPSTFSDEELPEVFRELIMLGADRLALEILQYFPYKAEGRENFKVYGFLYPNEGQPTQIDSELRALEKAGLALREGAYIALGSERGFLSAWIFKALAIFLVDNNPIIVAYNNINFGLLALSTSADDYRFLRLYASPKVWRERSLAALEAVSGNYIDSYIKMLQEPKIWWIWYDTSRNIYPKEQQTETGYGLQKLYENDPLYFKGVNYLYDEARWAYLHELALGGRLRAELLDIRSKDSLEKFYRGLKELGLEIGVFDLSNAVVGKISLAGTAPPNRKHRLEFWAPFCQPSIIVGILGKQ